jgi:hypothetical protein
MAHGHGSNRDSVKVVLGVRKKLARRLDLGDKAIRGELKRVQSTAIRSHTSRMPFVAAGAVTGIGSLPLTPITEAIRSVAEFSPEVPFWPQLPQLSERESIVGQGLGIVQDLIEAREEGYGYQVKEGQLDSVLEILHRSTGELTSANAAGFGAFEEALSAGLFSSALAVKGQIEGPITLSAFLFHKGRPFLADPALFAANRISYLADHRLAN